MSRELFKKIVLDALKSGIELNLEEAIKKFEETREEFELKSFLAFSLIHVIPPEIYENKIPEAHNIVKQFDEKDSPFIALALN